jgi:high-affinity iron transporter
MMDYRGLLQEGAPLVAVESQAALVNELLDAAHAKLNDVQLSPTTAFVSALVILLREGAEAILVVAAILAFLARGGRNEARRYVHAGWIAALALGGATWAISNYLIAISGANREMTEGITALIAAVMLLYVGYWLHSKSHSSAWQKYIGDKVGGALSKGTVWTLAAISFLAVYREAFETVLFYQALVAQAGDGSHGGLIAGVAVAVLLLVILTWVILRASVKLPLGLFFSVSGIVLLVLAVVFTGQGIAALQEAGTIGAHGVRFVSIPMLGIYPTMQTLSAQAVVTIICVLGFWWVGRAGSSAKGT